MDEVLMMCAAALLSAAEGGMVVPEGAMPTVALSEEGAAVTAGDQQAMIDADTLAEATATLMGLYDDAEEEAAAGEEEAPAETPAE